MIAALKNLLDGIAAKELETFKARIVASGVTVRVEPREIKPRYDTDSYVACPTCGIVEILPTWRLDQDGEPFCAHDGYIGYIRESSDTQVIRVKVVARAERSAG